MITDWWKELIGGSVFTTAASYVAFKVRRIDHIDRNKADRSEVVDAIKQIEQRLEKRDDEARQSRRELHKKFDQFAAQQHEINREMARVAGRINGR